MARMSSTHQALGNQQDSLVGASVGEATWALGKQHASETRSRWTSARRGDGRGGARRDPVGLGLLHREELQGRPRREVRGSC